MTNSIILDSSALVSLFSPQDANHQTAKKISKSFINRYISVILPGEIFTETVNVFGKKVNHKVALKYGAILIESDYAIADTNDQIRSSALKKFQKQPQSVSFTDCLVMAFADEYKTNEIFGFDEVFKKNGYTRIGIDK